MSELDRAIKEALTADDAQTLERLVADQSLHEQILATFRGRLRWLNIVGWIAAFALFAVGCACGWRFVREPELRGMLIWGAGAGLAFAGLALIKMWFWMELQKNTILREVKRLELQTARLAARFAGGV